MRKPTQDVDPIDEVRAVRDALAKQCDYDVEKLARLIKADEAKSEYTLVSRSAKRIGGARKAS